MRSRVVKSRKNKSDTQVYEEIPQAEENRGLSQIGKRKGLAHYFALDINLKRNQLDTTLCT